MLFRRETSYQNNSAFICFALAFTVMMILVTGLIIPNSSSIIRYKSIYLPLLITPITVQYPVSEMGFKTY
ncbi:MAG: hypothetical protein V9E88_12050 [Ferruginibacter sp.]